MTDEINKYIAVEIMGLCWHNPMAVAQMADGYSEWHCRKCREPLCQCHDYDEALRRANPDYCSDTAPRSLLNAVVAKVRAISQEQWSQILARICGDHGVTFHTPSHALELTAETIARAVVEAHKLSKS